MAALTLAPALPQDSEAPKTAVTNDIFSGKVTDLTPDSLTVVRKVPAKPDVTRKFLRDQKTKVEGSLKVNARVSVRYQAADEGQYLALNIIVR